jgi:hypothetical protein
MRQRLLFNIVFQVLMEELFKLAWNGIIIMEPTEPDLVARWAPFIGEQFPNEITPEEEIKIRLSIHFSGENNARLAACRT